jgi:hypothetical protein
LALRLQVHPLQPAAGTESVWRFRS